MKKIAISGSTGLIAGGIISHCSDYEFIPVTRKDLAGDIQDLYEKIKDADIILNLAGAPIIKRWSRKNKREIYTSRIETTGKLVRAIGLTDRKVHLISASATGIYNERNSHGENSTGYAGGFVQDLIMDWEAEALKAGKMNCHVTIIRIGLVFSGRGGMIKRLLPLFKMGLGGTIGKGQQYMSFIHLEDLARAIRYIAEKEIFGVVNLTSPEPVTNKEFTRALGNVLGRPAFLKVPVFALTLWFGKGAEMIVSGRRVYPEVLLKRGFVFRFPGIMSTLKNIVESA